MFLRLVFLSGVVCAMGVAQAATPSGSSGGSRLNLSEMFPQQGDLDDPRGFWGFVGLGTGLLNYEEAKGINNGTQLQIKGVGSYYTEDRRFVILTGMGIHTGEADTGRQNRSTTSAMLEASGHYRANAKWHFGPAVNFFVGNGQNFGSASRNVTTFAGLSFFRDFRAENHIMRLGGRVMGDIGIEGQNAMLALIEVQMSLPMQRRSSADYTDYNQKPAEPTTAVAEAPAVGEPAEVVELESWPLRFEMGKALPTKDDLKFLNELGRALAENQDLFDEVRILGHADERGSADTNRILSTTRASSVSRAFIESGLPVDKVRIYAMSSSQPLTKEKSPGAYTVNRRVEVQFIGVKDQKRLDELLKGLKL